MVDGAATRPCSWAELEQSAASAVYQGRCGVVGPLPAGSGSPWSRSGSASATGKIRPGTFGSMKGLIRKVSASSERVRRTTGRRRSNRRAQPTRDVSRCLARGRVVTCAGRTSSRAAAREGIGDGNL
jgi:hypothetical protein